MKIAGHHLHGIAKK